MSQLSEYWQDRCNELECDVADLRENLEFWKGEYEAGVGRVQILEDENRKLQERIKFLEAESAHFLIPDFHRRVAST